MAQRGLRVRLELFGDPSNRLSMLTCVMIPDGVDDGAVRQRLLDDYRIEIPLSAHRGQPYLRISVQGYNTKDDLNALVGAVSRLL